MTNYQGDPHPTGGETGSESETATGPWERWAGAGCALALWAVVYLVPAVLLGNLLTGVLIGAIVLWAVWEWAIRPLKTAGAVMAIVVFGSLQGVLAAAALAGVISEAVLERTVLGEAIVFGIVIGVNVVRRLITAKNVGDDPAG